MKSNSLLCGFAAATMLTGLVGCSGGQAQIDKATQQVNQLAQDLDRRTTETGAYIRVNDVDIKAIDPWGTRIQVVYVQEGLGETLTVASAGPDREFQTPDDIRTVKVAANLSGVGRGIKQNVEGAANDAAKGLIKGTVQGVKESIKDALPPKKGE